jgi:hypothetical protein
MPIQVQYQPPANVIADAALYAGQGEFAQQQQAQALRQQALQQQAALAQQEHAVRLYAQQQALAANQNSQLFQAAKQSQLLDWQRNNQLADQKTQRDWHVADISGQQKFAQGQLTAQQDFAQAQQQRAQQSIWEVGSVQDSEKSLNDQLANVAANREQLASPEDQAEFDRLNSQWKSVRGNRAIASSPKAFGEAISKFQAELGRSGILDRMKPPPTAQDRFDRNVVTDEYGRKWVEDRNGAFHMRGDDPLDEFVSKNLKTYQRDDGSVDGAAAMRDYQDFQSLKQSMRSQMAVMQGGGSADDFIVASGAFAAPPTPRPPTVKTAKNFDEYWGVINDTEKRAWLTQAGKTLPAKTSEGKPINHSPDQVMAKAREMVDSVHGFNDPHRQWESYRRQNPEQAAALETWAKQPPTAPRPVSATAEQQSPPTPMPATPRHINEVPEAFRAKFAAALPQPTKPEEIASLKPGTVWLAPDGSIREVP